MASRRAWPQRASAPARWIRPISLLPFLRGPLLVLDLGSRATHRVADVGAGGGLRSAHLLVRIPPGIGRRATAAEGDSLRGTTCGDEDRYSEEHASHGKILTQLREPGRAKLQEAPRRGDATTSSIDTLTDASTDASADASAGSRVKHRPWTVQQPGALARRAREVWASLGLRRVRHQCWLPGRPGAGGSAHRWRTRSPHPGVESLVGPCS